MPPASETVTFVVFNFESCQSGNGILLESVMQTRFQEAQILRAFGMNLLMELHIGA